MISYHDIEDMHPEYYDRPSFPIGNSLLGLQRVIKALEAHLDTEAKRSMGHATSWHVLSPNRYRTRN